MVVGVLLDSLQDYFALKTTIRHLPEQIYDRTATNPTELIPHTERGSKIPQHSVTTRSTTISEAIGTECWEEQSRSQRRDFV
jgi:hypothetical protein